MTEILILLVVRFAFLLSTTVSSCYSVVHPTAATTFQQQQQQQSVLIVGSANADTFLPVARLPIEGENIALLPGCEPSIDVPGGKGCTQAVAVSKLLSSSSSSPLSSSSSMPFKTLFIGQFGDDSAGRMLHETMEESGIICSELCEFHSGISSGRGYVFLQKQTGSVSAIVSGGSNIHGWCKWEKAWNERQQQPAADPTSGELVSQLMELLDRKLVRAVLLQREVPEYVNLLIASCVKEHNNRCNNEENKIVIFQDVGGEDRKISESMLKLCDYIVPNESELKRLVKSSSSTAIVDNLNDDDDNNHSDEKIIIEYAKELQRLGAANVLVTRGSLGSILLAKDGTVSRQSAIRCDDNIGVVDETGAGDCFRAAFSVAYIIEKWDLNRSLRFANAAGSCSVEKNGAVPSTPNRDTIMNRLMTATGPSLEMESEIKHKDFTLEASILSRGGGIGDKEENRFRDEEENEFPFMIGSRLNSMKDRPDLFPSQLKTPRDFVKRQATVRGLTCVDFNYPQHFESFWTPSESKKALDNAGLKAGAVCLRYPSKFARGAMNNPDYDLRREAIQLTKDAADAAKELGCDEVVIWSAFDGYDYPFQVDYDEKWDQLVSSFQELCDSYPRIKFSLEYKPTDENTRFFTVPTTGAALLLIEEINRPNMGLTLDVGHMLMAGENPGQSIAMVGRKQKLFGIQLNDGFTRLAAEDGLIFGSVHPSMALEIMYQLYKTKFKGHVYFDTFPQRSDPVKEAEYNIRQVKRFWHAAKYIIDSSRLQQINNDHNAIKALELVDEALRS